MGLHRSLLGIEHRDAASAFAQHPYAWLWLLVPVCGPILFCIPVAEEQNRRQRMEMQVRKAKA